MKSTFLSILFHCSITEGFRKVFNLEVFDDVQHEATCTGILSSLISLARVFGSLLGGVVSDLFGFKAAMYVAAALTAAGFVLFRISIKDKDV